MNGSAKTRVAVNGYGVIGKRVAEAIVQQDDLELAGVSDIGADWRPRMATHKGFRLFGATAEDADAMRKGWSIHRRYDGHSQLRTEPLTNAGFEASSDTPRPLSPSRQRQSKPTAVLILGSSQGSQHIQFGLFPWVPHWAHFSLFNK
jgi:hypothetical protein